MGLSFYDSDFVWCSGLICGYKVGRHSNLLGNWDKALKAAGGVMCSSREVDHHHQPSSRVQ